MKKIVLLLIVGCWLTLNATAQEVKFGARAGLNLSKLSSESITLDNVVGFHLGAVADLNVYSDFLYFQPGLMLSSKGGKFTFFEEMKTSLYYLEIPLMLSGKYAVNSDIALRANVGPYLDFGLFGKTKVGDAKENVFTNDGYKRFDMGLGFGAGVEFQQFYLGLGYNLGLANVSQDSDEKVKNGTLYFSLGYNF